MAKSLEFEYPKDAPMLGAKTSEVVGEQAKTLGERIKGLIPKDVPTPTQHTGHSVVAVPHLAEAMDENGPRIELPLQGSDEEKQLWEKDQKRVREFIDEHSELFQDAMLVAMMQSFCFEGNVEGARNTNAVLKDPVLRYFGTVSFPIAMYKDALDGQRMNAVIQRVKGLHRKYGITDKQDRPTELYGDPLYLQTYHYLMSKAWFDMDTVLKRRGETGVDTETMLSALRIGGMAARRMQVEGIQDQTLDHVEHSIDEFADEQMFREDDRSASRRLAIEMAYSSVEALGRKLPKNSLMKWIYKKSFAVQGMRADRILPYYRLFDNFLKKITPRWLPKSVKQHSDTQTIMFHDVLNIFPENTRKALMITEVAKAVAEGKTFDEFAAENLQDFETEVSEKWRK